MVQPADRADARANRIRLLEAAHQVLRERGLDAEMKEIAERAGVGIGTIYRNFPTKEDLITAIMGEAIARMQAACTAAEQAADPVAALTGILRDGFAIVDQYGDLLLSMMQGDVPAACREEFAQLAGTARMAAIVQRGIEAGVFRADLDAEVVAAALIASMVPWNYQQLRRSHAPEQIVAAYTDLFLRGVLAGGKREEGRGKR